MREPENINQLCALPIDYIGFIFYPHSPRYIGDGFGTEISGLVPHNIAKVGVFVNENINSLLRKAEKHQLQYIQLHGNETPDYCLSIKEHGYTVVKAFKADPALLTCETADYRFACDYYLFDTPTPKHGGSGEKFDWEILKQQKLYHTFFLSGGIARGDEILLKNLVIENLFAIDINSRFEISPGLKDIPVIKEFIENLSHP